MSINEEIVELVVSSQKFKKLEKYIYSRYGLLTAVSEDMPAYLIATQSLSITHNPMDAEPEVEVDKTEVRDFTATVNIINGEDVLHNVVVSTDQGWDSVKETIDDVLSECLDQKLVVDKGEGGQIITIRMPNGRTTVRKVEPGQKLEITAGD